MVPSGQPSLSVFGAKLRRSRALSVPPTVAAPSKVRRKCCPAEDIGNVTRGELLIPVGQKARAAAEHPTAQHWNDPVQQGSRAQAGGH